MIRSCASYATSARSTSPSRNGRERGAFPCFVLTAVLREPDRFETLAEAAEESAGVDLGELARVTDEHDLGPRAGGVVEEACERAGADHAGFVDDEHGAGSRVRRVAGGRGRRAAIAMVWERMPAVASSSAAARAASAAADDVMARRCQASRAASSANVLPVPAGAMTTSTPWPLVVSRTTISTCSSESSGRAAQRARARRPRPRRRPRPSRRAVALVDEAALEREELDGRVGAPRSGPSIGRPSAALFATASTLSPAGPRSDGFGEGLVGERLDQR